MITLLILVLVEIILSEVEFIILEVDVAFLDLVGTIAEVDYEFVVVVKFEIKVGLAVGHIHLEGMHTSDFVRLRFKGGHVA
jgi:hypothetical protein